MQPLIPYFEHPKFWVGIPGSEIGLEIHMFGILVAIGFWLGGRVAMAQAKRYGQDPDIINRLITWLVFGTFVGGRLGYVLFYDKDPFADPIALLDIRTGLSSFGGFAVCVPLAIWFFYKEKVNVWAFMDFLAVGMSVGWFFGRMGCFSAHDHPGTVSNFWLAVEGICERGGGDTSVACHDMGLYEALWSLAMFGVLFALDRYQKLKPGLLVLIFGGMYGPLRFGMDFLRPESTDKRLGLLTFAQYGSIVVTLVCIFFIVQRMRSSDAPLEVPADSEE